MERRNQPDKCSIQLAVGEMGASAHTGPGSIRVVGRPGALGVLEVALDREGLRVFEVHGVVICGPGVLWSVRVRLVEMGGGDGKGGRVRREGPCTM